MSSLTFLNAANLHTPVNLSRTISCDTFWESLNSSLPNLAVSQRDVKAQSNAPLSVMFDHSGVTGLNLLDK